MVALGEKELEVLSADWYERSVWLPTLNRGSQGLCGFCGLDSTLNLSDEASHLLGRVKGMMA